MAKMEKNMKKQTMVYVQIAGLLVASFLAALAFRAAAARRAQAEIEAMATELENATDQRKCVTVNAGETAAASDKGIEVRPTAPKEAKP
jgi:CHASE1-domain containing sensor protein